MKETLVKVTNFVNENTMLLIGICAFLILVLIIYLIDNSIKTKIGSMMGIKMDVSNDNSDSAIAHLMIEGLTMGVVDIESKINRFDKEVDKKIMKLAKDYLNFHNNYIKLLKIYL